MKINKTLMFFLFVALSSIIFSQGNVNLNLSLVEKKLPFGLTKKIPQNKPIVSLALSGGGARAISHIGVLQAIEELEIPIDHIVGTSMGSVVAGLYSAGYSLSDLEKLVLTTNWEELFFLTGADRRNLFVDQKITEDKALFTARLNGFKPVIPQSINTGNKISNFLTMSTLKAPLNQINSFDDLLYKYRVVATELISGDKIVIDNGSLSEAMRASSSVSFVLPPIKKDSLLLVDGGLVDNLPIKTALELNPDFIIASDATSSLKTKDELIYPWDIADQIVTIPSRMVWTENRKYADVLINHDLNKKGNNDFVDLQLTIEQGYFEAKKQLVDIKKQIQTKFKEQLSISNPNYYKNNFRKDKNLIEEYLYNNYSGQEIITASDLLADIYSYYEKGIYENIWASFTEDSLSVISINYKLNPTITSIKFNGINKFPLNSAFTIYSKLIQKPYNIDDVLESTIKLISYYRSKDYLSMGVDRVEFDKNNGVLIVNVNEGIISNLVIEGNENTSPQIIKREFPDLINNNLQTNTLSENLQNLYSTDLFDNMCVSLENIDDEKKELHLRIDEKLSNVMRIGFRIDNENFTQLAFDLRNENLFGTGSELGFSIAGGSRKMTYVLENKTNRIFNTYLTYKAQAFYKFNDVNIYSDDIVEEEKRFSRSKVGEYRQRFYGGFLGIGAHLKKIGTLTTELKYEVNEVDGISSYEEDDEYKLNISSLKFRLQIDSQNKYPYPTKGSKINAYYETAQKALGGDVSFAKFSFDYFSFFTLGTSHTLSPKIIFGFADETLPLSQQFNFGGQTNFWGYRDYEFRGRQVLVASLQYRYKLPVSLYFDTYLKIRYDLGSSWINQEQIHFKDLKHGIGLSLSFDTPVGPVDFSVGRSLLLKETSPTRIVSRSPFMFYFSIGYYY